MEVTASDKEMLGGVRAEDDVWAECTKVILGLLEDSLLKEDQADRSASKGSSTLREELRDKTNGIRRDQPNMSPLLVSSDTAAVKRKRGYVDGERDRKMQKISSNLANEIARSLTMNDAPMQQQRLSPGGDDVDMSDTSNNKLAPSSRPRAIRKIHNRRSRRYAPMMGDSAPIPTLRRISSGNGSKGTMDFERWLKTQAQRHNLNMLEYRQAFYEKKRQLQQCLSQIAHVDHTKTDDEQFLIIKENLSKMLRIADELSGDHTLSIMEIFPEWRSFEGHINKIAAYVQSIEDMKQLVTESIPRTDDLLHDIRRLQSVLDAKTSLYGDNLTQNGLEWKAMGLPVDENLLVIVKGWFYNLCIGLLCELDTECSKVQSLVTDMRELLFNVEGEKLMESILCGLEFISGVISFIGLPSRKLIYGCQVLATIYGRYISEHLDQLHQTVVDKNPQEKGVWMDVKMVPSTMRSARVDIRFMQHMESMTRTLSSLQTLHDGAAATVTSDQQGSGFSISTAPFEHATVPDLESVNVLENFTSMLVEVVVRAISVVETCKTTSALKSANVMAKPETSYVYMEESLVTFADKIVEASGRDRADGPRLQRLHAYLEDVESSL